MGTLCSHFSKGCKPRERWLLGTEHEKIGYHMTNQAPLAYDVIESLLLGMAVDGWQPVYEEAHVIALKKGMASVTLEPGGQLELSGEPLHTVFEIEAELLQHLNLVEHAAKPLGVNFLTVAFQPKWSRESIPWMPKSRYALMQKYMPQVGKHGLDMMLRTATTQVNLDYSSEQDMVKKMRISCCLQPLVTALYAASPFVDAKKTAWQSWRSRCWLDTDQARTGIPAMIFEDNFGFESYAQWALDAPMYFVMRDEQFIDCMGQSFRDFLEGKLPALMGEFPTMDDWELHLSTLFPDVRLKSYLEMRGADTGSQAWICSLPALWKGLLYDEENLQRLFQWVEDWTHAEVNALRHDAAKEAFHAEFRGQKLHQMCAFMLQLAQEGLHRLHLEEGHADESVFLQPLLDAVQSGQTQADVWLAATKTATGHDMNQLFSMAKHWK
ncbi:MAG: glutamate--cysteine ligase [Mariprofundaceae bacterium]|nr:glutamate--cysteine ligase [Mariprofundaceae bacterium]